MVASGPLSLFHPSQTTFTVLGGLSAVASGHKECRFIFFLLLLCGAEGRCPAQLDAAVICGLVPYVRGLLEDAWLSVRAFAV